MRIHPCILIVVAAAALGTTACDTGTSPIFGSTAGNGSTSGLSVTPSQVNLHVGGTAQLSTNATATQQSLIEWNSQTSTVAAVSPSGLVTAIAVGSTTIVARLSSDTTQSGSATVTVTP